MRFFNLYQYAAPLVLLPLAYWLWLERSGGEHRLALLLMSMPVVYAYVVPAVGTNVLRIWEFNTRLRLGRFRPHHGFVFGSATSLIALACLGAPGAFGVGEILRTAFVLGSVLAFWNWLYDVAALRSGFLRVYTRSFADRRGPEAVAMDYAPPIFGLFGMVYGAAIVVAEHVLRDAGWNWYWPLLICANLACIAIPVAGYVAWSYARNGENGLKSHQESLP
jgi:hypothetical protein